LARKRSRLYSDREAINKLIGEEPFKTRWGDMDPKTLRNWLGEARKLFDRPRHARGPSRKSLIESM
jgi:hypothetical protein